MASDDSKSAGFAPRLQLELKGADISTFSLLSTPLANDLVYNDLEPSDKGSIPRNDVAASYGGVHQKYLQAQSRGTL